MMDRKSVISEINLIFKRNGFIKKGNSWRKSEKDVAIIIALQKSRYSNNFTFEVGICVDQSRDIDKLTYYACGISFRLNKIPGFDKINIDGALDLDSDNAFLFSEMIVFLERNGINIINLFFDLSYLKLLYNDDFFKSKMIDDISRLILSE
ncbi:DUF4304 domain-containing protein [Pectobacterium wasabiae]|uniref:DUF4304 domain-containing protein n=1 Tax=Pectobacterium wasabiae TaxID=55208 RepID=A0AAW3EDI3_9GAMM|nr:DUF4304 domain-containing protein [Pectobacterium wasabiae]AOR63384.1 hypothetical protein A7983_08945 [Pectobacterium wasabiae CFBP 3304]EJS96061.1 Hypothetical protein Y17_0693 [Pectobacterium wasabiae CFBP 3304]KFX04117.1 hypothetical protein JV38_16500 [Pectobacterium wasabiae]KGA27251.1 hypothetical protein KU73_16490 [Pectobacterium wasabiae]